MTYKYLENLTQRSFFHQKKSENLLSCSIPNLDIHSLVKLLCLEKLLEKSMYTFKNLLVR